MSMCHVLTYFPSNYVTMCACTHTLYMFNECLIGASQCTPSLPKSFVFDKIKITGGTLVIGGDFFDFWFNYQYVIPSGYVDLLEHLSRLHRSGISIHFVLGNHDYWDFGYFNKYF